MKEVEREREWEGGGGGLINYGKGREVEEEWSM